MYLTPYFTSCHLTFVKLSWKFLSFFLNSLNVISTSPPYKGSSQIWRVPDFMNMHDKNAAICNKEQKRIQNSVKHLRWSFLQKAVNYIHKKLHFRCLTRLWIRLWSVQRKTTKKYYRWKYFFCIVTHHCTATYGIGLFHMCDINFGHILSLNINF